MSKSQEKIECLDCVGLECPKPVMRCRDFLQAGAPEKLHVLVDNPAAVENVSRFLGSRGYATSTEKLGEKRWQIAGLKQDGQVENAQPENTRTENTATDKAQGEKTLVLLTTETLGRGDDDLGAKLMVNFLGSLSELGPDLWRVILLNGAVKLAATPGACLDHLKKLEASGTSILVCGTCLMHYGLMEKKQVGETTNMMDVVTSLALARKIIRP